MTTLASTPVSTERAEVAPELVELVNTLRNLATRMPGSMVVQSEQPNIGSFPLTITTKKTILENGGKSYQAAGVTRQNSRAYRYIVNVKNEQDAELAALQYDERQTRVDDGFATSNISEWLSLTIDNHEVVRFCPDDNNDTGYMLQPGVSIDDLQPFVKFLQTAVEKHEAEVEKKRIDSERAVQQAAELVRRRLAVFANIVA